MLTRNEMASGYFGQLNEMLWLVVQILQSCVRWCINIMTCRAAFHVVIHIVFGAFQHMSLNSSTVTNRISRFWSILGILARFDLTLVLVVLACSVLLLRICHLFGARDTFKTPRLHEESATRPGSYYSEVGFSPSPQKKKRTKVAHVWISEPRSSQLEWTLRCTGVYLNSEQWYFDNDDNGLLSVCFCCQPRQQWLSTGRTCLGHILERLSIAVCNLKVVKLPFFHQDSSINKSSPPDGRGVFPSPYALGCLI